MTVSYQLDVSTATLSCFCRLLLRWRGSIWKAVLIELIAWTVCYALITMIYRTDWFLSENGKMRAPRLSTIICR
ncbi:hypothetical protein AB6A40_011121 [Gnathostoma spinigerum]|uniref:Bestrophin homolog n=1 Tax=Gnathostoma spinigerum TaxID=75299 RepID=A0ABD6F3X8_9BILA